MKTDVFSLILAAALAAAAPAWAHHSFAMYDREKTVVLNGTVKAFSWTSPHVGIELLTDRGTGFIAWQIEASSPTVLTRSGWNGSMLKPGDKVLIGVHPRKDREIAGGLLADEQQILVNCQTPRGVLWLQALPENSAAGDCAAAN